MSPVLTRKTRSGRTFLEILEEDHSDDLAVLQLDLSVDMDLLAQQAVEACDAADKEIPAQATTPPLPNPEHMEEEIPTEPPSKRVCMNHDTAMPPDPKQSANNRRCRLRRTKKRNAEGHPCGTGRAFDKYMANALPISTQLATEELPIAEGGWVASNASHYGAKVKRDVESLKKMGFTHVPWKGRVPVCAVDKDGRLVLAATGTPNNASYLAATDRMAELMLRMGKETAWKKEEKDHVRGKFPSAYYGWSYGKGQHQPQRLGGKRQGMMRELINQPCIQRIAAFQSASFALWFPKSYGEFHRRNLQLKEKVPAFEGNIKGSVFSCCTANFGENTWTYIHRDVKNVAGACCAITSGGPFDHTKGGHLIIWDLKLIFDFPSGSTILLPSALFCHSNTPVQEGDQRVSFTQYTAGGIHRWLEYGGRTEEALAQDDPEGYRSILAERPKRWQKVLNMFSDIHELKAGVID